MELLVLNSSNEEFEQLIKVVEKVMDFDLCVDIDQMLDLVSEDVLGIVFDLDSNQKKIEKSIPKLRKVFPELKLIGLCNNLAPKKLVKHQSSKYGLDLYLRTPIEASYLKIILEQILNIDILDEVIVENDVSEEITNLSIGPVDLDEAVFEEPAEKNEIIEAHTVSKEPTIEAKEASDKLDQVFSEIFIDAYKNTSANKATLAASMEATSNNLKIDELLVEDDDEDEFSLSLDDEVIEDVPDLSELSSENDDVSLESLGLEEEPLSLGDDEVAINSNTEELDFLSSESDSKPNVLESIEELDVEDSGAENLFEEELSADLIIDESSGLVEASILEIKEEASDDNSPSVKEDLELGDSVDHLEVSSDSDEELTVDVESKDEFSFSLDSGEGLSIGEGEDQNLVMEVDSGDFDLKDDSSQTFSLAEEGDQLASIEIVDEIDLDAPVVEEKKEVVEESNEDDLLTLSDEDNTTDEEINDLEEVSLFDDTDEENDLEFLLGEEEVSNDDLEFTTQDEVMSDKEEDLIQIDELDVSPEDDADLLSASEDEEVESLDLSDEADSVDIDELDFSAVSVEDESKNDEEAVDLFQDSEDVEGLEFSVGEDSEVEEEVSITQDSTGLHADKGLDFTVGTDDISEDEANFIVEDELSLSEEEIDESSLEFAVDIEEDDNELITDSGEAEILEENLDLSSNEIESRQSDDLEESLNLSSESSEDVSADEKVDFSPENESNEDADEVEEEVTELSEDEIEDKRKSVEEDLDQFLMESEEQVPEPVGTQIVGDITSTTEFMTDPNEQTQIVDTAKIAARTQEFDTFISSEAKAEHRQFVEHHDEELLRLGETIKALREDRETLMNRVYELEHKEDENKKSFIDLQALVDEKRIELSVIKKRYEKQVDDLKFQLELKAENEEILKSKQKKFEQDFEKQLRESKLDERKIRTRERELEEKLDMLKADSEVQIRNRDKKILELKRRIDTLEFDIESSHIKEQQSKINQHEIEDKMDRVIDTLKSAIDTLDSENGSEIFRKKLKNNLDV